MQNVTRRVSGGNGFAVTPAREVEAAAQAGETLAGSKPHCGQVMCVDPTTSIVVGGQLAEVCYSDFIDAVQMELASG